MVFITTSDAPLYNKGNKTVCTEDLNEHTQSMEDRCDDNIATQSAQISNIDCTVELTESTSEDLPTAKTVMMETMGLKEICEERAQRIVDESAASPGRPVRRRRCSVPVWQNLIPKSSKKVTANRIKNTVEGGNDRLKRKQKAGFEEEPKSKQETGLTCVSARQQRLSKRLKTLDCLTKDESPKTSDCGPTKDESPKTPDCRPTKDESPKTPDCRPTKDELPKTLDCHPTKDESPKMEPGVEIVSLKGRRCDVCGKHYSTPQNMRRHRVTHSNFKAYKCSFCSQRFHFVQYLREHVIGCLNNPQRVKYRNHDRIRPSPVMMKHLQIVQSPHEPNTFINLPCDISEEIPKVNAQEEIKNLTAENDAEEMLKQVSEPAVDLEEARQHHRETTKEFRLGIKSEDWQTADGQYKCNICDKVILNQYNLYRHLQTHTDCKRYKCIYCGRRFTLGQYLKDHVISCKNNKKRVTISTNRRRINRDLKQNIIILPSTVEEGTFVNAEKEEESWTVEEGEEFDVEYVKESQDEELYQCSEQEWTNYYAHRSNDGTGKRAFTLSPHLIEVFKTEKKLGDNRLKDNMLNPYHCTVCNERKFNRAETLRRHLWSHMDNAHKCVICGVNFRYQEYLKSHVLQLHFGIKRKRKSRAVKQLTRHKSSQKNSTNVESDDDKINKTNQGSSDVDDDDKINKTNQGSSDVDDDDKTNKTNQGSSDVDDDDKINKTNQGSSDVDDDDKINKTNQGSSDLNCYQKPRTKQNRKSVGQLNNFQQRILFQCVECSNKFFKYENLLWHQYHTHGLASFTKCPVCDVGTANGSLLSHLVQHHQKVQQPKPVKVQQPVYKCSQCDQSFSRELTMLIHQQKHTANTHPDKGNQCPICNITFTTFGNMRRHFKVIHSDEKPFMCHLCGKSFKTNDSLKCHVKIHDREKHLKYRCKTCGKGFFRNRLLKEHETLHVPGATTCMCDVCGKRFRLKPNLSKHMKSVHNLERNHVCSMCGKAFKLKEQLKNHMRYHVIKEGKVEEVGNRYGKIYQCETCGKFCPSSYSLKIHQTSHSPSRPYSCQLCGRNFKVKSKIQRHLQTVHNTKKRLPRKQLKTEMDESNVAESIVEVIVNSEADLVDNTKMYSLLDRSYSSSTNHNDPTVIEEAVQGISGNQDYILQGVQEVEDQPGTYIVSDTSEQSFSLSVDEGPKTLIYYITTD